MIVKCQRSLDSSDGLGYALFYNEDRSKLGEFLITDKWNKQFGKTTAPHDNKFFAEVEWEERDEIPTFIRKVKAQDW